MLGLRLLGKLVRNMDYSKIIEFFKQPQLVFVVAVTTGLIVFLPDRAVHKMGLAHSRNTYLPFIAIIFLVATVQFITQMSIKGYTWNKERNKKKEDLDNRLKLLKSLNVEECDTLKRFIEHKTITQRLDVDSGIVNSLLLKGIIYRATNRATSGFADHTYYGVVYSCDHNLQPWAWEYLNEHPELLARQEKNTSTPKELSSTRRQKRR